MRTTRMALTVVLVGTVGALCVLGVPLLTRRAPFSWAAETSAVLETAETLLRGLADRESRVSGVAGETVIRSYYAPRHWARLVSGVDTWQEQLERGHVEDRDLNVGRFQLGRERFLYEVQAGLWAGGGNYWFPLDFSRTAANVDDLYLMVWGDGEHACKYQRGHYLGPTARLVRDGGYGPACLRGPFSESLGLSRDGKALSQSLRSLLEKGYRVSACGKRGDAGEAEYELTLVGNNPHTREQLELRISPSLQFAPTRILHTSAAVEDARLGQRNLWEWADFGEVGEAVFLPYRYKKTTYFYTPDENQAGSWECQTTYQYFNLALIDEPSLSLTDWRFPLSVRVEFRDPSLGDDLDPSEQLGARGHLLQAEGYVPHFLAQPLPTPDPVLNRPYTGDETKQIEARYREAQVWVQHD